MEDMANLASKKIREAESKAAQTKAQDTIDEKINSKKPVPYQPQNFNFPEKSLPITSAKMTQDKPEIINIPSRPTEEVTNSSKIGSPVVESIKNDKGHENFEILPDAELFSAKDIKTAERQFHKKQTAETDIITIPERNSPQPEPFTQLVRREPIPIHEKTVPHRAAAQAIVQTHTEVGTSSESVPPPLTPALEILAATTAADEYAPQSEQAYKEKDIFVYQALLEDTPDTSEISATALETVVSGSIVETVAGREHIFDPTYQETTDQLPDEDTWLADAFPDLAVLPESLRRPARTEIQAEALPVSDLDQELVVGTEADDEPAAADTLEYPLPTIESDDLDLTYAAIAELPVDMPVIPLPDLYADFPPTPIIENEVQNEADTEYQTLIQIYTETESIPAQEPFPQTAFEVPDILLSDLSPDSAATESVDAAHHSTPVTESPKAAQGEATTATPDAQETGIPDRLLSLAADTLNPATPEQETATIKELITDINILLDEQIARPARPTHGEVQPPKLSRETVEKLLQLMTVAGYEDPSGMLVSFIEHYGYGQLSELMRRLAQLAEAGNRHEFVAATTASGYTFFGQDTATAIGKILLGLHQPGWQPAYA